MYHIRYTEEIIAVVDLVADVHDTVAEYPRNLFRVVSFIFSLLFMPFSAIFMLFKDRNKIVMKAATSILIKYCDLELKNNC